MALAELEALGLGPPAHLTLRRYLALLVELEACPRATAEAFARWHEEASFAAGSDRSVAGLAARDLVEQVRPWLDEEGHRDLLRARLAPPPPLEEPAPTSPEVSASGGPEAAPSGFDPRWLPETEEETPPLATSSSPSPRRRRWRLALLAALLLLAWSAAMVAVGWRQGERIEWLLSEIDYHLLGGVRTAVNSDRLAFLRAQATLHPDSAGAWQSYANAARSAGLWDEVATALRHLVVRNPDNAELLNELAWLLCTAPAEHVRDPVEALALAERAHALDRSSHITDTLAEAAFQMGQIQRAVALERDALARAPGEAGFYRRQLAKFEAALPP